MGLLNHNVDETKIALKHWLVFEEVALVHVVAYCADRTPIVNQKNMPLGVAVELVLSKVQTENACLVS